MALPIWNFPTIGTHVCLGILLSWLQRETRKAVLTMTKNRDRIAIGTSQSRVQQRNVELACLWDLQQLYHIPVVNTRSHTWALDPSEVQTVQIGQGCI